MTAPEGFADALLLSVQAIGKLFLVVMVGFFFVRSGKLGDEAIAGLTRLMIDVIVPCALFVSMVKGFNSEVLETASALILLPVCWLVGGIGLALLVFRLVPGDRRHGADRAAAALCGIQNSFYVPLPLALAITAPEQHELVFIYTGLVVLAINPLQWTLGTWLVMGERSAEDKAWRKSLKLVFNGPVVGVVLGALLAQVPMFPASARGNGEGWFPLRLVLSSMEFLGTAIAPMAMLLTGAMIARCRLRHNLTWRRTSVVMAIRFAIVPALVWWLIAAGQIPGSGLVVTILMLQAAAPPAMNMALVARRFDGEWEVVSALLLVTNTAALLVLPLWMAVGLGLS